MKKYGMQEISCKDNLEDSNIEDIDNLTVFFVFYMLYDSIIILKFSH